MVRFAPTPEAVTKHGSATGKPSLRFTAPWLLGLSACLCLAAPACSRRAPDAQAAPDPHETPDAREDPEPPPVKASIEQPRPVVPQTLRFLAFGGGSDPASNQISLAQDVGLFRDSMPGPGLVLFASGKGAQLAIDRRAPSQDNLGDALARLFGPPGAELTDYTPTDLAIDGPATTEHVVAALERALQGEGEPLLVYGATHGERGSEPADNSLSLWGGWELSVRGLAELLDHTEHPRPTRFVLTACYGGGFADLAFVGASPSRGPRSPDHCGLFAAPWDDEASGCDPSPDRRGQESFAIHFLHALRGEDRERRPLPPEADLDGDGQIGLLDAHAWARVASHSFDVPTTTSERYLRSLKLPRGAKLDPESAPEDAFVARVLGNELGLTDEPSARDKLAELDSILADVSTLAEQARGDADDAFYALRIALVERWPLLAHPWEERSLALVKSEERAISALLRDSDLAHSYAALQRELDELLGQEDTVRITRARVLRLVRAQETLRLASAAKHKGGADYRHFQALRSCERYTPSGRPAPREGPHAALLGPRAR
jgi:hypothetical protein